MRLFLAINLPEALKQTLAAELSRFDYLKFRAIPASNWHVTIKFLDDLDEEVSLLIREAVEPVASQFKPFELSATHFGFLNRRIFAIFLARSAPLYALYRTVDSLLAARGIAPLEDARQYTPHITIGRKHPPITQDLHAVRHFDIKTRAPLSFSASSLDLMCSELQPAGAVYGIIARYEFSQAAKKGN